MAKKSALPPQAVIRLGRWGWETAWQVMMSQMAPRDSSGAYQRPQSTFRQRIQPEPSSPFPPASGRYHLLVGLSCPWAHRTLLVRSLKGLTEVLPLTLVRPSPESGGWLFETPFDWSVGGQAQTCQSLAQFYALAQPGYAGRSTVPVLWDSQTGKIVNNESAEIIVILNEAFNAFADCPDLDLYPPSLRECIDTWNAQIYDAINNGVYRCGFAQTQSAYNQAINELFTTLDEIDRTLANQRYLCGHELTLADIRLFTTLIRFDVAYFGLFKCDRRRIAQYPYLSGYLRDLYQHPGIADTCDLKAVKRDYYGNLFPLNPGGIIPTGPDLSHLLEPHNRFDLERKTAGQAKSPGRRPGRSPAKSSEIAGTSPMRAIE